MNVPVLDPVPFLALQVSQNKEIQAFPCIGLLVASIWHVFFVHAGKNWNFSMFPLLFCLPPLCLHWKDQPCENSTTPSVRIQRKPLEMNENCNWDELVRYWKEKNYFSGFFKLKKIIKKSTLSKEKDRFYCELIGNKVCLWKVTESLGESELTFTKNTLPQLSFFINSCELKRTIFSSFLQNYSCSSLTQSSATVLVNKHEDIFYELKFSNHSECSSFFTSVMLSFQEHRWIQLLFTSNMLKVSLLFPTSQKCFFAAFINGSSNENWQRVFVKVEERKLKLEKVPQRIKLYSDDLCSSLIGIITQFSCYYLKYISSGAFCIVLEDVRIRKASFRKKSLIKIASVISHLLLILKSERECLNLFRFIQNGSSFDISTATPRVKDKLDKNLFLLPKECGFASDSLSLQKRTDRFLKEFNMKNAIESPEDIELNPRNCQYLQNKDEHLGMLEKNTDEIDKILLVSANSLPDNKESRLRNENYCNEVELRESSSNDGIEKEKEKEDFNKSSSSLSNQTFKSISKQQLQPLCSSIDNCNSDYTNISAQYSSPVHESQQLKKNSMLCVLDLYNK